MPVLSPPLAEGMTKADAPSTASPERPLRIAVVAPPWFSIPPSGYGGVENVVADLVDGLVERGHEVTLVGAGEHRTRAQRFLTTYQEPPSARLGEPLPEVLHTARVAKLLRDVDVDIVHDHTLAGPLLAGPRLTPTVVTAHGPVGGEAGDYFRALGDAVHLVAISHAQRGHAPDLPWIATVHNALRVETFPLQAAKDDYVLFLGRFHPNKSPHVAIDAARAAGIRIVLAGKCSEPIERDYFDREVLPRLGPDVELFGVADGTEKRRLLAGARCLVFPICWEEPFGMVMIEAMACGTPVVALRRGSVPEIVIDGVTGIVVDDPADLPAAIANVGRCSPDKCRLHVAQTFTVEAMAQKYEAAYRQVLAGIIGPSLRMTPPLPTA